MRTSSPSEAARGTLPRAEQRDEHRLVQIQKLDVLKVPLRIRSGRRHELLGLADVEPTLAEDSGDHRRARAVHARHGDHKRVSSSGGAHWLDDRSFARSRRVAASEPSVGVVWVRTRTQLARRRRVVVDEGLEGVRSGRASDVQSDPLQARLIAVVIRAGPVAGGRASGPLAAQSSHQGPSVTLSGQSGGDAKPVKVERAKRATFTGKLPGLDSNQQPSG